MFNVHYVKVKKSLILILIYGHFEKLSFKWIKCHHMVEKQDTLIQWGGLFVRLIWRYLMDLIYKPLLVSHLPIVFYEIFFMHSKREQSGMASDYQYWGYKFKEVYNH